FGKKTPLCTPFKNSMVLWLQSSRLYETYSAKTGIRAFSAVDRTYVVLERRGHRQGPPKANIADATIPIPFVLQIF
ncbi:hypothetical protein ACFL2Q_17965, partial [Thermodesulfobacteriota bacterium]